MTSRRKEEWKTISGGMVPSSSPGAEMTKTYTRHHPETKKRKGNKNVHEKGVSRSRFELRSPRPVYVVSIKCLPPLLLACILKQDLSH